MDVTTADQIYPEEMAGLVDQRWMSSNGYKSLLYRPLGISEQIQKIMRERNFVVPIICTTYGSTVHLLTKWPAKFVWPSGSGQLVRHPDDTGAAYKKRPFVTHDDLGFEKHPTDYEPRVIWVNPGIIEEWWRFPFIKELDILNRRRPE